MTFQNTSKFSDRKKYLEMDGTQKSVFARKYKQKHKKRYQRKVKKILNNLQTEGLLLASESDVAIRDQQLQVLPEGNKPIDFKDQLRQWKIEHNITRNAMNDLLKILFSKGLTESYGLPRDSRTLMQTPENLIINNVSGGKLWYHGIGNNIRSLFRRIDKNLTLSLNINIDGIPLFNSSKFQFWPILADIYGKF